MTWSNNKNLQFKEQHNDKEGLLENVLNKNNWKVKTLNNNNNNSNNNNNNNINNINNKNNITNR